MDFPRLAAYTRRIDYLSESMGQHSEQHSYYIDGCERCKNIKNNATGIIDDMPSWMYKMLTVFMWIRSPIMMYHAKGSIRNLNN